MLQMQVSFRPVLEPLCFLKRQISSYMSCSISGFSTLCNLDQMKQWNNAVRGMKETEVIVSGHLSEEFLP